MAVQKLWLGAIGPYLYDDAATIEDDDLPGGELLVQGLISTMQLHVLGEATEDTHVLRLGDLEDVLEQTIGVFDSDSSGIVPASGGGTTNFLRADGTWAAFSITDAELLALAGPTSAADKLPYFTGSGTAALADFTAYARTLVDDADAAAARTTLGLGTIATQAASAVAITGGTIAGINDLAVADGGTGASSASAARTNLGLAIGTNVQAYSATLDTVAATATAAGLSMLSAASATAQTALLDALTSGAKGLAPASGGGSAKYLRADGTWAVPPGTGLRGISWSPMDEPPASANAKNEEMVAALTGVTWVSSVGTPASSTWTTMFDDTAAPANPRYSVDGSVPEALAFQPTAGGWLYGYKAFAPASGTKWAMLAKVRLLGASGADDRVMLGVGAVNPSVSPDSFSGGSVLFAEYACGHGPYDYRLSRIRPSARDDSGQYIEIMTAYLALVGKTDNSITPYFSTDGIAWRAGTALTGGTVNGGVVSAFVVVQDLHNSGASLTGIVEYWRFLEGDNNLYAMGCGG